MGHLFKTSNRALLGILATWILASAAFAQASLTSLDGGPEGLVAAFQGGLGQSLQTIQVLLGQSVGLEGALANPAAEGQTQGVLPPEQQEAQVQISRGIARAKAWDRVALEQVQGIVGKLEGRSSQDIQDYWFFSSLGDQLFALTQRLSALGSSLGLKTDAIPACELNPASSFLCDEAAWEDFRRRFILENYGAPALKDSKVNNDYAWELAYLSGVVLRQALGDLEVLADTLSPDNPLLPFLTENLSVFHAADAFVSSKLKGYRSVPSNQTIEGADMLSGDKGDSDGA